MNPTFKNWCAILFIVTIFISCERSNDFTTNPTDANKVFERNTKSNAATEKCRLTFTNYGDGYFTDTYQYNAQGLVSDFNEVVFGNVYAHATMQYDKSGRMVKGIYTYDNITYYDVVFEYEKNRIVREIGYEPGTTNITDITINTYNKKGEIIKRDDPVFELYTTFE